MSIGETITSKLFDFPSVFRSTGANNCDYKFQVMHTKCMEMIHRRHLSSHTFAAAVAAKITTSFIKYDENT